MIRCANCQKAQATYRDVLCQQCAETFPYGAEALRRLVESRAPVSTQDEEVRDAADASPWENSELAKIVEAMMGGAPPMQHGPPSAPSQPGYVPAFVDAKEKARRIVNFLKGRRK